MFVAVPESNRTDSDKRSNGMINSIISYAY